VADLERREIALAERELKLSQASADLDRRRAEFNKHVQDMVAAVAPRA
jgi:hypothetical protein